MLVQYLMCVYSGQCSVIGRQPLSTTGGWLGKQNTELESPLVFTEQNKTQDKALVTVIEHMMTLAGMQIGPQ